MFSEFLREHNSGARSVLIGIASAAVLGSIASASAFAGTSASVTATIPVAPRR